MIRTTLKKYIALLLVVLLVVAPLAGCGGSAVAEESVELASTVSEAVPQSLASVVPLQGASPPAAIRDIFPDAYVAEAIAIRLGRQLEMPKTVDSIVTQADLDQVLWISLFSTNATSLEGVQYLREIVQIIATNSDITDLSPLSGLINLSNLSLTGNQISDLSPLSGLINLWNLNLDSNQISDLGPLSGLVNLTDLSLSANQISDLSPLSGLAYLEELYLSANQINALSPLSGLVNLRILSLGANRISDLNPLSGLTSLGGLLLSSNQIVDFSPIPELTPMWQMIGIYPVSVLQGRSQQITLEPISQASVISIANPVRDQHGDSILPNFISDGGIYENGMITWSGLTTQSSLSFSWARYLMDHCPVGWFDWVDYISGVAIIPLLPTGLPRTVTFQLDGIDTPITVFPNFPIDWNQSAEAQEIYNTGHEFATGLWPWEPGTPGRAFWGWFRSEELLYDRDFLENRPALGTMGVDLSTLTFTEEELEEDITLIAVWSYWGDVDDNGAVEAQDVLFLNRWLYDQLLERQGFPAHFGVQINLHAADVNVDGVVDHHDVLLLNQWLYDRFLLPIWGEPYFGVVLGKPAQ